MGSLNSEGSRTCKETSSRRPMPMEWLGCCCVSSRTKRHPNLLMGRCRCRDAGENLPQSRFLGRGCDEALFSERKGFSVKSGEAIQWIGGLKRISTGKAIQWRASGHSLNRQTLKTEKLLSSSPSRKSALITWGWASCGPSLWSGTVRKLQPVVPSDTSTLSHLKSCNPVGGTPSSTACFFHWHKMS